MIFEEVAYDRFIKVFLFIVFATKVLRHKVFFTEKCAKVYAKCAGDFCSQRREVAKFFVAKNTKFKFCFVFLSGVEGSAQSISLNCAEIISQSR
jgi:hypothetical protein